MTISELAGEARAPKCYRCGTFFDAAFCGASDLPLRDRAAFVIAAGSEISFVHGKISSGLSLPSVGRDGFAVLIGGGNDLQAAGEDGASDRLQLIGRYDQARLQDVFNAFARGAGLMSSEEKVGDGAEWNDRAEGVDVAWLNGKRFIDRF